MKTVTYDHKGWFGICPVYLGRVADDAPDVVARWSFLEPLLTLSAALSDLGAYLTEMAFPQYEWPGWCIRITGRVDPPIQRSYEEEP